MWRWSAISEPQNSMARVVVIDRDGWETRYLLLSRLTAIKPLRTYWPQERSIFCYQTETLAAPDNVAVLPRRKAQPPRTSVAESDAAAIGDAGVA